MGESVEQDAGWPEMSADLRFCRNRGWLVGPRSSIPGEPEEFCGRGMLEVIACNNLVCARCGARVRNGVGFLAYGSTALQRDQAYLSPDWKSAPGLVSGTAQALRSRLYMCRCDAEPIEIPAHLEEAFTTNEGEEYRTPPWACAETRFDELLVKCLRGWAPEAASEEEREHPQAWLHRLYAHLVGTGLDSSLAGALALLVDGEDRALLRAALRFYQSFPEAEGYLRVLALWDRGREGILAESAPGDPPGETLAMAAFEALASGVERGVVEASARVRALLVARVDDLVPHAATPARGRKRPKAPWRSLDHKAAVERLVARIRRMPLL